MALTIGREGPLSKPTPAVVPVILLTTRLDPVWLLAAGVMLGGLGLVKTRVRPGESPDLRA